MDEHVISKDRIRVSGIKQDRKLQDPVPQAPHPQLESTLTSEDNVFYLYIIITRDALISG